MAVIDVPRPDFMADPEIEMFSDAAGKFFERHAPRERVEQWEAEGKVEPAFWREAGEAGLLGVSAPAEFGGHGGDFRHDVVVVEQQHHKSVGGFAASLHNTIIMPYIINHGTDEQKKRWIPKLTSGELISAIAMSEPDAGSDLQAIRTTAKKDGNGYRINGSKTWISNGQIANLVVVVCKTDPEQGAAGTSLLVLETEDAEGFTRGKNLDKIGQSAQDTSELFFDNVFVPADNLLGGEEGRGFYQLMGELPGERVIIAVQSMLMIEQALDETVAYTSERKAFGRRVLDFQNTQFKLADLKAEATICRVFLNDCIKRVMEGGCDTTTAAIAKLWITELQGRCVDQCLQFHGGAGYINEYPIAKMYRDARVTRIFGGSSEIMRLLIARSL